jgi:hypothetical protein
MAAEENTNWDYKPSGDSGAEQVGQGGSSAQPAENISWTAKEFIEHDRNAGWYTMLILGSVVLAALIYLITKDFFAVGATVVAGIIGAIYAGHKPNDLNYELSDRSIKVGERTYNYSIFKAFSIAHEGAHTSIVLEPIKRFMPPMTLYFPPEKEDQLTEVIGNHLPLQEYQPTTVERLSHRLRF